MTRCAECLAWRWTYAQGVCLACYNFASRNRVASPATAPGAAAVAGEERSLPPVLVPGSRSRSTGNSKRPWPGPVGARFPKERCATWALDRVHRGPPAGAASESLAAALAQDANDSAMRKNYPMLNLSVSAQRQLAELMSEVYRLLESVQSEEPKSEVSLRTAATLRKLDAVGAKVGREPGRAFASLARHLYWLERFYLEDRPDRYASDVRDIRSSDLPGVIKAVEESNSGPLDEGLFAAVNESWEAHRFAGAVRDAFIYLEAVIREMGEVDPARGLSGDKLVTTVLDPSNSHTEVRGDTFLGPLTRGEATGFYYLVRGAFLLFRNSAAHRPIEIAPDEAEDIIRLVDLCLRLLPHGPPKS